MRNMRRKKTQSTSASSGLQMNITSRQMDLSIALVVLHLLFFLTCEVDVVFARLLVSSHIRTRRHGHFIFGNRLCRHRCDSTFSNLSLCLSPPLPPSSSLCKYHSEYLSFSIIIVYFSTVLFVLEHILRCVAIGRIN